MVSCEFEVVDFGGVPVRCSHRIWSRHITSRHPELEGQQAALIAALTDPDYVYQSGRYPDRKLHYRREVLPYPYAQDLVAVVVAYPEHTLGVGQVVTAYRKRPDVDQETLIWSRQGATP